MIGVTSGLYGEGVAVGGGVGVATGALDSGAPSAWKAVDAVGAAGLARAGFSVATRPGFDTRATAMAAAARTPSSKTRCLPATAAAGLTAWDVSRPRPDEGFRGFELRGSCTSLS